METTHSGKAVHPSITELLKWFDCDHLPKRLKAVADPIKEIALDMVELLAPEGGAELTVGLRKLLEAKDCLVRAALKKQRVFEAEQIVEELARVERARQGKTVPEDLKYSATSRCCCGAGLAFVMDMNIHGHWDCSAILLGVASSGAKHTAQMPFAYYNIKCEGQPSANGATTRPTTQEDQTDA